MKKSNYIIEDIMVLIKPYLKRMVNCVIDIGTADFSRSNTKPFVDVGFKALLVEPNPYGYGIIKNQTKNMENVVVLSVAIYDFVGTTKFLDSSTKDYSRIPNSLWKGNFLSTEREIEVKCWTMEKVFEEYPEFEEADFIDIDVEGTDEIVLDELFKTKCRPKFILIEHQKNVNRITAQKEMFNNENYSKMCDIRGTSLWKNNRKN